MRTIGIMIERQRAYGRRLCEGIVRFAQERCDWSLRIIEFAELDNRLRQGRYDGFIVRVMNDEIAKKLAKTGKPVVDVFFENPIPGFAAIDQSGRIVGQMAARHFIEHRFTNFAFCGYDGRRYSDDRKHGFIRFLELNHHHVCACYRTPAAALKNFEYSVVMREHFGPPSDSKCLTRWIQRLPKPVAVFCAHDMRAYQLSEICRAEGIRVPDEVAILGTDDDELVCLFTEPPISSIDQNAVGIGYAAAQSLQKMLDSPGTIPPLVKVKPLRLVERGSTMTYPLSPKWLSDALAYIQSNIPKNISASDVYTHVGKSHTLVDAAFRSRLGTSVQKEISRVRLKEARRLVLTTSMPMQEIAKSCGYSSLQYFSNAFSRVFGTNPSSLRH